MLSRVSSKSSTFEKNEDAKAVGKRRNIKLVNKPTSALSPRTRNLNLCVKKAIPSDKSSFNLDPSDK
jgi:hypothetical protein